MITATATTTGTAMTMGTGMGDDGALLTLLTWLSPGYPIGAYTYSHGVERAVETGEIHDGESLGRWIEALLRFGGGHIDAVMLAGAWRAAAAADEAALDALTAQARAQRGSAETALESLKQGEAFVRATQAAWPDEALARWAARHRARGLPLAVALGLAAAPRAPLRATVVGYLHSFAANLISAGVRLVPLGQTAGLKTLAALEGALVAAADRALATDPAQAATAALWAELASVHHETQHVRLFRS